MPVLEELMVLERRGWDALCASTGGEHYGALMIPESVMVLVDGTVLDRDAVVASLDRAPAWDDYELTEARLVPVGADAAALVYLAVARRGAEEPFRALMSSTYVDMDGATRLALYQQTALPG